MLTKLYNIWQKCSWENLQHSYVICSPHLFSVVTLPHAGKQSAIQLCMYMWICSVNSSHNVNDKNVQAEQNHSNSQCLYVNVITCVRSVRLRQIHNSEGVYATRRWPCQLRAVALQTTLQPIAASAFAVVYLPKADTSNTSYDTYVL